MRKALILVLTSMFILVMGAFISATILTPYARSMGATWIQIGILSGGMYAVRLFIATPVGRLADRKGTVTVLKYSLMLFPFIAMAYYFSFSVYSLIGARLLHGVASAMLLPMAMAFVGQASPEGMEGRYMSIYNLCFFLASGIGPFISTIVAGFFSYRSTFLLLFIFTVAALLIIITLKDPSGDHRAKASLKTETKAENEPKNETETAAKTETETKTAVLIRDSGLMALSMANIALAVVSSLVGFFMIPFLEDRGISLVFTGSLVAVYNVVSGVVQLPFGKAIDKLNKVTVTMLSGVFTALAMLIFPLTGNMFVMGAAMTLVALGSAVQLSSVSALSVTVGRRLGMGSTMGFLSTSNSIGMIFGCISLSLMPEIGFKFESFFYISSAIMLVCTVFFAILWVKRKDIIHDKPVAN